MKKTLSLILLLLPFYCFSSISIKRKLIDVDKKPIPYANVVIKNTTIGVITNLDGDFNINIPYEYQESTLVFSSIGYKTKEILINTIQNSKEYEIILETDIINLDEITIRVKATNANEIVQNAFNNYYQNFPSNPFIGKAFLRHTEKTPTEYKWLVDAAIEIYDPGFNKPSKEIKLNIKEIKRSIDNRSLDSANIYGFYLWDFRKLSHKKATTRKKHISKEDSTEIENSIRFQDSRLSSPSRLFTGNLNVIRYYKQKDAIFDKSILKKHNFKIDSVLAYNADEIYKIKITPKLPPAKLNGHFGTYCLPVGWIYIRAKDYAIIELEYTLINSKKGQIFTHLHRSKIASSFHIKFIEIDGKMYPKHIIFKAPKSNNLYRVMTNTFDGSKVNPEDYYYETQEVIFNEIIIDNTIITKSLEEPWNNNLFTPRPYNIEFWNKYSNMVETKEQKTLREALELKKL
ncbi:carboxypeptidase-like regulatory domain-containing protein [Labilibaculum euxinus]